MLVYVFRVVLRLFGFEPPVGNWSFVPWNAESDPGGVAGEKVIQVGWAHSVPRHS